MQGKVRSGGIQCLCMSFITVSRRLFKSPSLWSKPDLEWILGKEDQLFKFIGKLKYQHI